MIPACGAPRRDHCSPTGRIAHPWRFFPTKTVTERSDGTAVQYTCVRTAKKKTNRPIDSAPFTTLMRAHELRVSQRFEKLNNYLWTIALQRCEFTEICDTAIDFYGQTFSTVHAIAFLIPETNSFYLLFTVGFFKI